MSGGKGRGRRYALRDRRHDEAVRAAESRALERQRRREREASIDDTDWLAEDERKVDR